MNGSALGPVTPSRGLRQGCPLSPYLFILCAQGLSLLVEKAVGRGDIHGIEICRGAPGVASLLFADDSFFFFRATAAECATIKDIFDKYEVASGQAINYEKSGVFFSRNTTSSDQALLSNILEVHNPLNLGRYLSLPSMIGRSKKAFFKHLRDKLWKKTNVLRAKFLSKGGREVLIKSVAQALPMYCMNVLLIPQSVTDELQKMMNSF